MKPLSKGVFVLLAGWVTQASVVQAQQVHASGGATQTASGTINTTVGVSALLAETNGVINSNSPLTISTTGIFAYGAEAATGGKITIFEGSTISTTDASAIFAYDAGSLITVGDGVVINTQGLGSNGIWARDGAHIQGQGLSITTSGSQGIGVLAHNAEVTLGQGIQIVTSGALAHGLLAADINGKIVVEAVTITTDHYSAYGIYAQGGQIIASTATVSSAADNVAGLVKANTAGSVSLGAGSQVMSTGDGTQTLQVYGGGKITADGVLVSASGLNSFGVVSLEASSEILLRNGSRVITTGDGAYGLQAYGLGHISTDQVTVSTSGAGAHGVVVHGRLAYGGGSVSINQSTITTSGAGADALSSHYDSNSAIITNSSLSAANGVGVSVLDGTLNASFENSSVSGGNGLLDVASSAALNIDASNTRLTGTATTASGGTGQLTLSGSSVWNITGDSNLTHLINQSGSIAQFSAPSSGAGPFKTLTVEEYAGVGGTLGINTHLDDDGSPTDRLIVDGGSATGSSFLAVHNVGGAGALTTADGILVVNAINGGTTVPGLFTLAGPVIAGPYEYSLYRGGESGADPDNWYLRSELNCSLAPSSPVCGDDIPDWREEVPLYSAVPSMALLYGRLMLDTLHERRGAPMSDPGAGAANAAWGRIIGQRGDHDGARNGVYGSGAKYDYEFGAFQGGVDLYRSGSAWTARNRAGAFFAIGNGSGDVQHIGDGKAGQNSFTAYSWGGYWTHYTASNAYIDAIVLGSWYDIDAKSTRAEKLKTDGGAFGASLQGGYPVWTDASGFKVEPQAQLAFQAMGLSNASDSAAQVRFSDVNSLVGRLGVRIAQDFRVPAWLGSEPGRMTAWVRPNIWYEFLGDPKTSFSSDTGFIPFASKLGGSSFEINTGFSTEIASGTAVYANASYLVGLDQNAKGNAYDGKIGVKVAW